MQLSSRIDQLKRIPTKLLRQWSRYQRIVFLFACLAVIVAGVWKGYHDVYVFQWTEQQKSDYREKSLRLVQFRESAFDRVIEVVRAKSDQFVSQTGNMQDIFGAGPIHPR